MQNKKLSILFKSNNLKNSYWIIGEQIFQMLLSLVVGMMTARYLGPGNYGTLNYTASYISFFSVIASLGMEGVIIKKFVENPEKEGIFLGSCIVFRLVSSAFSTLAIAVIIIVLDAGNELKLVLALLQSLQLFFKSFNILDTWFQRHLKSKYTSIGKMTASIIVSGYKIFLLVTAKGVVWFAVANALSDLVIGAVLFFFYLYLKGDRFAFSYCIGKGILLESYHFIISDIMAAVYKYMDKIMIAQIMLDVDVGYYTSAITISAVWAFLPNAMISSFRPTIMELKKEGKENLYQRRLTQLYSLIIWMSIIFSFGVFVFADFVIDIFYGKDYAGAVNTLRIMVWAEALAVISTTRSIWILCEKKNRYVKYYIAIGAVVNICLNFVLIPRYGIEGAAFATLVSEFTVLIAAPVMFRETRGQIRFIIDGFFMKWLYRQE